MATLFSILAWRIPKTEEFHGITKSLPWQETGDPGSSLGLGGSPGVENGNPLQYSSQENAWTEDLVGYSPWGCKESDIAE